MQTLDEVMSQVKLPKLYRVIKVQISALRNSVGEGYGIIFDCDTIVERKVRRVLCPEGWKWQLVRDGHDQEEWDYYFESDKECLSDYNCNYDLI